MPRTLNPSFGGRLGAMIDNFWQSRAQGPSDAQMMAQQQQALKAKAKALAAQRAFEQGGVFMNALRNYEQGFDPGAGAAAAFGAGVSGQDFANWKRALAAGVHGAHDPVTNAMLGAGGAMGSTPAGFHADQTRQREQFESTPVAALFGEEPRFVPQADVFAEGVSPILTDTQRKGTLAGEHFGGMGDLPPAEQQYLGAAGSPSHPRAYLLPDRQNVLSHDGRTYVDPRDGETRPLPPDAAPLGPESGVAEIRMEQARQAADEAIPDGGMVPPGNIDVEAAARRGTGPYAAAAAGLDNVLGGLGIPQLFGEDGLFIDTQESRTALRTIRQLGKIALVNNPRFPVAEQRLIDDLFPDPEAIVRNPNSEARKLFVLRSTLEQYNLMDNQAIANAIDPKEVSEARERIQTRNQLLGVLPVPPEQSAEGAQSDIPTVSTPEEAMQLPSGTRFRTPDGRLKVRP